jgi:pyridoxamine 5'-phosphate oxidase
MPQHTLPPTDLLPEPLPAEPLTIARSWLDQAWRDRRQPNPNAMVLATSSPEGLPSARVVLCKDIAPEPGTVTFYTNYLSRKGRELEANARAALVLHWDHMHRQVRVEGRVVKAPRELSQEYFASRARESRVGAWASKQSEPVPSRKALLDAVVQAEKRFEGSETVPCPPHWGGFVLWAEAVELWAEGEARIHDRARWTRPLKPAGADAFEAGPWSGTRLQP